MEMEVGIENRSRDKTNLLLRLLDRVMEEVLDWERRSSFPSVQNPLAGVRLGGIQLK